MEKGAHQNFVEGRAGRCVHESINRNFAGRARSRIASFMLPSLRGEEAVCSPSQPGLFRPTACALYVENGTAALP